MNVHLMKGDCLQRMEEIPDGSVDLTVTSPPYDNLRTYLFANAVVLCDNLTHEQKTEIVAELEAAGINPKRAAS